MKQKPQKRSVPGTSQRITKAVTHIRLLEVNPGKLAALETLAPIYLALCQEYVTFFCTEQAPDKFHPPLLLTSLSERWHRVAIQQAAGIAQSWRTNREQAYRDFLNELEDYREQEMGKSPNEDLQEPTWREWDVPTLQRTCIQANANVVRLETSEDSSFDYWLRISTLEKGHPVLVPVKLADYHRQALEGKTINSSVQLNKREDGWWLTLSYDEVVAVQTEPDASAIGIDVGIANFLTTSDGRHYGTFHGKLRERQKRDREKRRRIRHVKQEINRAVNQCFTEHPGGQFACEQLSVTTMKHKARAMNAYMRASNLAHIPTQIEWNAAKRGVRATRVKSAYTSQACSVCSYTDRANRPDQQTFCCQVCGYQAHADFNASMNIARRLRDTELRVCKDRKEVKALLMRRHEAWHVQQGWS